MAEQTHVMVQAWLAAPDLLEVEFMGHQAWDPAQ